MSVTLCLGEALVDLIGEAPAPSVGAVDRFEPHFGGATANVAVFAARAGARISLAGAAGEDRWGRWLRERLVAERVDAAHFPLVQGLGTQLAFVCVDDHGKPTYELYGELDEPLAGALAARIETAVDGAAGLFISSNTLAGAGERALTMRARAGDLHHRCRRCAHRHVAGSPGAQRLLSGGGCGGARRGGGGRRCGL
ncbi:MAG: hypothetical protein DLM64_08240 [Solirubrobacterales bacterium]|nr:MAG: hypothetical protein DLM64_08240 [Solirubrobacterales bacterium]